MPSSSSSSAPPTISSTIVGDAGPNGGTAGSMTRRFAVVSESVSWMDCCRFSAASISAAVWFTAASACWRSLRVRSPSGPGTLRAGEAARSAARLRDSSSRCCMLSRLRWAASVIAAAASLTTCEENLTYSRVATSVSCRACSGVRPWPTICTTLPSSADAETLLCRSLPLTPQLSAVAARSSTTRLVAICTSPATASLLRSPCSSTLLLEAYPGEISTDAPKPSRPPMTISATSTGQRRRAKRPIIARLIGLSVTAGRPRPPGVARRKALLLMRGSPCAESPTGKARATDGTAGAARMRSDSCGSGCRHGVVACRNNVAGEIALR